MALLACRCNEKEDDGWGEQQPETASGRFTLSVRQQVHSIQGSQPTLLEEFTNTTRQHAVLNLSGDQLNWSGNVLLAEEEQH